MPTSRARYKPRDGMIYLNSAERAAGELAAMIAHEGLHAIQVLGEESIPGTIEGEQDANLVECIVYHEMRRPARRSSRRTSVEFLYRRSSSPAARRETSEYSTATSPTPTP